MSKRIVIGQLGPTLDKGYKRNRWENWRPTISICQHEDHLIDQFELLFQKKFQDLADQVTEDIKSISPETKVNHHRIEYRDAWDFQDVFSGLYDFADNYNFDTDNNEYVVHITTGTHVSQICLFLLTESRHFPAKLLQTSPPRRKRSNEPGSFNIIDLDLSKYDHIAQRFLLEQTRDLDFLKSGIATRNTLFNRMMEQIEHITIHSNDPILLTGPTGAGKSQLAKRIYELKNQKRQIQGPLVEVNCATIRGDTAMSTLFGHTRGAFTGAATARKGLLVEANNGMLFLDEVGELGPDEQTMLLRAIEEKRFLAVGADKETQSEFSLICGTNRDLLNEVKEGRFREDLLARINLWTFKLPGLAERRDDIEPNIEYELSQLTRNTGRQVHFNNEARRHFLEFAMSEDAFWSANFRDVNACMRRMATMAPSGRITQSVVKDEIERLNQSWQTPITCNEKDNNILLKILGTQRIEEIDIFDIAQLRTVVNVCFESSSLSEAGRKLFAASRKQRKTINDADRLRKYLAKFDLDWQTIKKSS
ncbi:sigma 54-interacting transcriptional regulator [Planctomycetota bacterium]|nr:sigma 54-interacting transcriptional regulator [Planctomycetota bacterium]